MARRRTQVARAKSTIPSRNGFAPYVVRCATGRHDPLGNGTTRAEEEEEEEEEEEVEGEEDEEEEEATLRLIASGKAAKPEAVEVPEDNG